MRITNKKIAAVVATTAVVALGAGGAYAWVTNAPGTGNGTASVADQGMWGVDVGGASGEFAVGGAEVTYNVKVVNNSANVADLVALTPGASETGGFLTGTDCKLSWFSYGFDPIAFPVSIAANGEANFTFRASLENAPEDQTDCLGDDIAFTVTAS
jgi:hypothetical protein